MTLLALVFVYFHASNIHETLAAPAVSYDQRQTGDLNVQVDLKDIQIIALLDSGILGDYGEYDYAYDYSDFTLKPITPHATTSAPAASTSSSKTSVTPWHTWPTIAAASSTENPTSISAEHVTVVGSPQSETGITSQPENNDSSSALISESTGTVKGSEETPSTPASASEPQVTPTKETIRINEKTGLGDDLVSEEEPIAPLPAPMQLQASSAEKNPSSAPGQGNSEAPADQTQSQPAKKCNRGYARDQKGRCSRIHNRRRITSSLLPFGIRLTPRINWHKEHQSAGAEN